MTSNICSLVLALIRVLLYIKTLRNTKDIIQTKNLLKQKYSVYNRSLTVTVLNNAILRIISQKKKKKKKSKYMVNTPNKINPSVFQTE